MSTPGSTLEAVVKPLLATLLAEAGEAALDAPFDAPPSPLRVSLLQGGPRGLEALVWVEAAPAAGQPALAFTSAWSWIAGGRGPACVDAMLGQVRALGDRAEERPARVGAHTRTVLADREASHALVLPVAAPGATAWAMVALELRAAGSVAEIDALLGQLARAWVPRLKPLSDDLRGLRPEAAGSGPLLPVVGRQMSGVVALLGRAAHFRNTLLLTGEPGVGKTRLAEWVHARSPRKAQAFRAVELALLPVDLVESELFGWKKGAHAQASADRPGVIAEARGGTVFLDEIDRAPLAVQDKLLQLLERGTFRPLGANAPVEADVRFIVGSNADLPACVAAGTLRRDLFERVAGLQVHVPPLRERADELEGWAAFFASRAARQAAFSGEARLHPGAGPWLRARPWSGNLRELAQLIDNAWMLACDLDQPDAPVVLTAAHLEDAARRSARAGARPPASADAPPELRLISALEAAAAAWAALVDRAAAGGPPAPELDGGKVFGAAVLRELTRRHEPAEALRRLGEEKAVASRNTHARLRREEERWAELRAALGLTDPA
jgi:DNA-binding NtrC family response regulator